jgi:hypothetical protein
VPVEDERSRRGPGPWARRQFVVADVDPPPISPEVLLRHGAKMLDPLTALRVPGQGELRPTAYIADRLLILANASDSRGVINEVAAELGLGVDVDERDQNREFTPRVERLILSIDAERRDAAVPAPDAWTVLQNARARVGFDRVASVGLDHLMSASTGPITGDPYRGISGKSADPAASYGTAGFGGLAPVMWLGASPERGSVGCRRPRVAVLDTGTAAHPWFDESPNTGCVTRLAISTSPGDGLVANALTGALASDAGHGTFIAGLIRQACPNADILSIRIMGDDGFVAEGALIEALQLLCDLHIAAQAGSQGFVDIVSLSLGYYHESPGSTALDASVWSPIHQLGKLGVAVVAAAGNDSTTRPLYPAGFTPNVNGPNITCPPDCVPVASVGALNPNGSVALFSNAGVWVNSAQPGASVISTMPMIDGGSEPSTLVLTPAGLRATIDMDDFRGGFASWSGTSFSAPLLAGKIAQVLLVTGSLDDVSTGAATARVRDALAMLTEVPL